MSSILKGLNESYFNRDEQDQQNAMDTRRRSDLSGERNAGLNEPDELPTTPQQSRNGVYEYNVPTGQEKIAQELGLQLHKGHWFSRIPVQKADFQFGRPQFHEIASKNVSEAEQDYGPEYQDKVKRLGQMAKQGERKTVWDPVKRVYKTVPVNPPKEQGVTEAELDEAKTKRTVEDIFIKGKKVGSITTTTTQSGMIFYTAQVGNSFVAGPDTREEALKHLKRLYRDSQKEQGVAEGSKTPTDWMGVPTKLAKNDMKPIKRPSGYDKYIKQGAEQGFQDDPTNPLRKKVKEQGVAEGSNDTIYPNAEVIKSKNGKPVGEIYQDGNSWGAFHYRADRGYDFIDSREEAIEALKDLHQETGRSRPDYTIKGVAEGLEQDDPYKGTTPTNGKVAARNGQRLGKTYKNPHSPKYHKDSYAAWDRDYNNETSRLKNKGVAEGSLDQRIAHAKKNNPLQASVRQRQYGYTALVTDANTGKPSWFGGAVWQTPELAMGHAKAFVKGFPYLEQRFAQRFVDKNFDGIADQGVAEGSEYKSRHAHKQEQDKAYADYRTKHATSSMALMTRAEFAKDQRERAAKKKQGVAEGVSLKQKHEDKKRADQNQVRYGKMTQAEFDKKWTRTERPNPTDKKQGVAEGDRPGMKDGRPYSDPLRRHPGNDSYMTPEYLIQKYQDELKKIAAGPYKRPKDVAMYQARIAKLQRQQGVAEGGEKDRQWSNKDMERLRVATRDFDDIMASDGPDQTKHDLIKKRIQTKPMAGPKGVLPEQGVAKGSRDDDQPELQQTRAENEFARSAKQASRDFDKWAHDEHQKQLKKREKQGVAEGQEESCPHCGGAMFSEMIMNEKKDACYYKVKSRYKVWPSAYASGALVKCRKKGADSWGNGGKKNESSILEGIERADENLHKWFKEKWVRFGPDGKIRGDCARGDDSEGKPKCLPQSKAQNLGKKGRASAAARKRREDPNPERSGKAINVNTKKKSNEGVAEGIVSVGDTVWAKHPIQRYKSVTGKVLHTDDNSTKIQHRDGTTGTYPNTDVSNDYEELNPNPYRKKEQGVAEAQLDEKWSQKYKDSINCSNPKGFSQRAHCQGKNK